MKTLLYSFRRCPYAIRARLALRIAEIDFIKEEVNLKDKKKSFLEISPKGTVPVLVLNDNRVIDESIDIMLWAFKEKKLNNLFEYYNKEQMELIKETESNFKPYLDKFKYSPQSDYIQKKKAQKNCEVFLRVLENLLKKNNFFFYSLPLISDYALVPFIRQFFFSDKSYFANIEFCKLSKWLEKITNSAIFIEVMKK